MWKRSLWKKCRLGLVVLLCLTGPAWAVLREGAIEGRPGLAFRDVRYHFSYLTLEVANRTGQTVLFGGSMVFLDRHYRPVARAELLPDTVKRRSTRRYRASFTEGDGEAAASAVHLVWELNQRNR